MSPSCCRGIERHEPMGKPIWYHSYSCPNRATVPVWYVAWAAFRRSFMRTARWAIPVGVCVGLAHATLESWRP